VPPTLKLSTTALSFGTVAVNDTSAPQTVVASTVARPVRFASAPAISGNADFVIASTTCPSGGSLPAHSSCSVVVRFHPTSSPGTTENATLSFVDDAVGSPQTVSLSGKSTEQVTVAPTSLSFGSVKRGKTSKTQTVTIANNQSALLHLLFSITAPFQVASTTCQNNANMAAFGSCQISVTFSPTAVGNVGGSLNITDSPDSNSPHVVSLSGTGT